jgi:hypothetical protein
MFESFVSRVRPDQRLAKFAENCFKREQICRLIVNKEDVHLGQCIIL